MNNQPDITFFCSGIEELPSIADNILENFESEKVFAFFGEMGAGKTTLIKALCRILGVKENVCSPTFALVNEYSAESHKIFHFDFYRMKSPEEALYIGFEEYLYSDEYCFMEWPERIEPLLKRDYIAIEIEVLDTSNRKVSVGLRKV